MGESALPVLLVILITITSLTTSVTTFNKNPPADTVFKQETDDSVEDLTIIAPDQFDLEQEDSNSNDLKVPIKQFDDDSFSESDFLASREIYRIKDKYPSTKTEDDNYETKKAVELTSAEKDRRKLREQYQIDEAVIYSEDLENMDFRKRLEDVRKPSDRRNRTKTMENKTFNSKADLYGSVKSKATNIGRTKPKKNQLRRKSPEDFGLKQSPDPPYPDLVESGNKFYDPKESDLNTTRLMAKLGVFFDEGFMSIFPPNPDSGSFENNSKDESHLHNFTRNKNGRLIPKEEPPDYLKDINFKYIYLSDGNRVRTRISTKLKKKMQQFLQTYTKCRVSFKWKDLGPRFWPRYLRTGYCSAGARVSCSIPPGMNCRPDRTDYKTLLRFHCSAGRGGEGKCHWRNVQYPVVTTCTCACA